MYEWVGWIYWVKTNRFKFYERNFVVYALV